MDSPARSSRWAWRGYGGNSTPAHAGSAGTGTGRGSP
jgi:hypothetical protein